MLLFGHLGITLGIFFGLGIFVPRLKKVIDPRYLAVGALLPDFIDKPIGEVIFASTFANGRIIAHTLIFSLFLFAISLYMYEKRKDIRGFSLTSGSFFHLFEDTIPSYPKIFFWPLFGWSFPRGSRDYVGMEHLMRMFVKSFHIEFFSSHITEILAVVTAVLIVIFLALYWSKKRLEEKRSSEIVKEEP